MDSINLSNQDLELTITPRSGTWSVRSRHKFEAVLDKVRMGLSYANEKKLQSDLLTFTGFTVGEIHDENTLHGPARQVQLLVEPASSYAEIRITFSVPHNLPLMFWKIRVKNTERTNLRLRKIEMLRAGFVTLNQNNIGLKRSPTGKIRLNDKAGELGFFANGWQSWNYTGAYRYHEKFKRTRLGPATSPMRVNAGTPQPHSRGHFASDFFGILGDRVHRSGVLAGFLSQREHFGSLETYTDPFEPAMRLWANGDQAVLTPGSEIETDWACLGFLHLDTPDPLAPYLEAVAREHDIASGAGLLSTNPPVGWCSWYHYFQNISAEIISQNTQTAQNLQNSLPLRLIQIDDGFEAEVGDWLEFKHSFPQGLSPLSAEIRAAEFTPGIWLAPYIVHPRSKLAREHPDWLLRGRMRRPANAGYVWNVFTHGLDLTHPDAFAYTQEVIHTAAHKWGFDYLKLDFLYAAALPSRFRDETKTRAQVLRRGFEALREAAGPEATLLGCGCPLGSALGLFEAMRIGPDVAPVWHPRYLNTYFIFKAEPDFPSARNAVHNTLTRAPMHRRWWINDPDCLLVRPDSDLTLAEIQTLATAIALSGGSLLVSDDLTNLPETRLRIVKSLLPLIGKRPYVIDWFDNPDPTHLQLDMQGPAGHWHLLALFNWSDQSADLDLKLDDFYLDVKQEYVGREFWQNKLYFIKPEGLTIKDVPAHGCFLLAVRPKKSIPQYLGSNLHISQGLEISVWEQNERQVRLTLERPGDAEGFFDLQLPHPPQKSSQDGQTIPWEQIDKELYRFSVKFHAQTTLEIELGSSK